MSQKNFSRRDAMATIMDLLDTAPTAEHAGLVKDALAGAVLTSTDLIGIIARASGLLAEAQKAAYAADCAAARAGKGTPN